MNGINIKIEKDVITIIIDKGTMLANIKYDLLDQYGDEVSISNKNKFIKSVVSMLERELDESGKTLVHDMLAQAAIEAVEQGEEGVRFRDC